MDETLSHLPNLSKFEGDAVKVTRDITSARADMKRLEGRVLQSAEDFGTTKTEVTKLGKFSLLTMSYVFNAYIKIQDRLVTWILLHSP